MPLYGHELGEDITPYEAGLGKVVRLTHRGFVGEDALAKLAEHPKRQLVGLKGDGKRAARAEYPVLDPETGEELGAITSGALSPTLGYPVAMALILAGKKQVGDAVIVDVRGTQLTFEIVNLPFYKKER
jgi:aminomethyltransferase